MNPSAITHHEPGHVMRPVFRNDKGVERDIPAFMSKDRAAALELERLAWAEKCPTLARIARLAQVGLDALQGIELHHQGHAQGMGLAAFALDQARLVEAGLEPPQRPCMDTPAPYTPEGLLNRAAFFGRRP